MLSLFRCSLFRPPLYLALLDQTLVNVIGHEVGCDLKMTNGTFRLGETSIDTAQLGSELKKEHFVSWDLNRKKEQHFVAQLKL